MHAAVGAGDGRRGRGRRRSSAGRDEGRRGLPLWQELPLLLVIAFCVAILVRTFVLQAFYIPSGSMEETLLAGDRVLVNKLVYHFREPARGEIVVFRAESWSPQPNLDDDVGVLARIGRALGDLIGISRPGEKDYIKRIIGLPGDRISCCDVDGRVFLNGQPLDEPYVVYNAALGDPPEGVRDCRNRRFDEVVVEPGHMFVMGDHRAVSQDSRCQGQVLIDDIIGRADLIMWPSDRWGRLRAPEIFESVPEPAAAATSHLPSPVELVVALPVLLSLTAVRAWRRTAARFPFPGT
ncbi:MAG: signal peptidase I [Micromonosporaceae bacterium]